MALRHVAKPLRRHCVGAGSAATFTPRPLPAERVPSACLWDSQLPAQGLDLVKHDGRQRKEPAAILYDVTCQG